MASELARAMNCSGEQASENLMSLSPHEMKTLLHRIVTGTEFTTPGRDATSGGDGADGRDRGAIITKTAKTKAEETGISTLRAKIKAQKSLPAPRAGLDSAAQFAAMKGSFEEGMMGAQGMADETENVGQWLRRRRIDGALNRVPTKFYARIWNILRRFDAIKIKESVLHQNLTKEMTQGETKFALTIESVLNQIPEPEYRQLMVEALMVIALLTEVQSNLKLGNQRVIEIHGIVHLANGLFVLDQKEIGGESTYCCGKSPPEHCNGVAGLCVYFIDSAPSGRFGTLTYLCRAAAQLLHQGEDDIECTVS